MRGGGGRTVGKLATDRLTNRPGGENERNIEREKEKESRKREREIERERERARERERERERVGRERRL
jgi:hypothetical protein